MKHQEIIDQLKANSLHIMEGYQVDFDYDLDYLKKKGCVPFVHVTRPMGTHLFFRYTRATLLDPEKKPYLFGRLTNAQAYRQEVKLLRDGLLSSDYLYQYFDGEKVTLISPEKAVELLQATITERSYETL